MGAEKNLFKRVISDGFDFNLHSSVQETTSSQTRQQIKVDSDQRSGSPFRSDGFRSSGFLSAIQNGKSKVQHINKLKDAPKRKAPSKL